jgi:mono/diheme cytochrome c family protein
MPRPRLARRLPRTWVISLATIEMDWPPRKWRKLSPRLFQHSNGVQSMSRKTRDGSVVAVLGLMLAFVLQQGFFSRTVAQGPMHPTSQGSAQEDDGRIPKARELYQRLCLKCHGNDGTGRTMRDRLGEIPDFTNASWQAKRSNIQLRVSILNGRGTLMPSFGDRIGAQQAADLVDFIRLFTPARKE